MPSRGEPKQVHRPGLEFMVSTGRLHGFESLEERRLLLALDFVRVQDVLSQPFELGFESVHGRERHTPDYLAVMPDGGIWLFDVRPADLIKEADAVKFAAAREAAAVCGWHYSVVVGLRPHVHSVLLQPSSRGGKHADKWVVRSDRRDRRQVFLQDPVDHDTWHVLRWAGLPPEGEVPAFSDKSASELLALAPERGLKPRSDAELLPDLLEILGWAAPVDEWPTALAVLFDQTPPSTSGWGRTWTTLRHDCSPEFRQYVNETMPSQLAGKAARADLRRGRRPLIPTADEHHYLPEHIPQRLPDDWFAAMIGDIPPAVLSPSVHLRRFAAVQLVQIATNVEMEEAARFLGIPDAWHRTGLGTKNRRLRTLAYQERPEALDAAIARIVNHVSAFQNHSDYCARRQHFADWALSPASWTKIVPLIAWHGPALQFRIDDVLRETASAFVWALLTGSEWHLAPNAWTQLVDRPPQWRKQAALLRRITYRESPRFSTLHNALAEHAELLLGQTQTTSRHPT
ncbi:hypothetical protein ACIQCD_30540 [Streptomyces sp. NPDC093250]|uniref:hypothetical protein n=1 Tax=Streptomyces sp. NPDC093250 TaxID=3366036 RepID=UPI003821179E